MLFDLIILIEHFHYRLVTRCNHNEGFDQNNHAKPNIKNSKHVESIYVNVSPKEERTSDSSRIESKKNISHITEKAREGELKDIKQRKKEYSSMKTKIANVNSHKPKRTEILTTPELSTLRKDETAKERKSKPRHTDKINSSRHNQSLSHSKSIESSNSEHSKDHKNMATQLSAKKYNKDKEIKKVETLSNNTLSNSNTATKPTKVRSKDTLPRNKSPEKAKANELEKNVNKNSIKQSSSKTRSNYVINYDDKNGTVSSICKIKPSHDFAKNNEPTHQKHNSDSAMKSKVSNKSGFRK